MKWLSFRTEMKLKLGFFVFSVSFVQAQLPASGTDMLSPFRIDDQSFEPSVAFEILPGEQ